MPFRLKQLLLLLPLPLLVPGFSAVVPASDETAAPPTSAPPTSAPATNGPALPLPSLHLQNLYRAAPNVFSGGAPIGDAAFAELAKLGVKTVISVDGTKPDVTTARRHGLRYIHLPFGYDGVPANRIAELAQAAHSVDGPLFVHCHHGLHRGPAAVAVICESTAHWSSRQAISWLRQAGTSPDYPGLYRSVSEFRPPTPVELAKVDTLPEVAPTTSLVDAMVAIDAGFERLKAAQTRVASRAAEETGVTSLHPATALWEQFRELGRADDTAKRSNEFREKLAAAETATDRLRSLLTDPKADAATRTFALRAIGESCVACHRAHRN